jgi:hypothetical protein
VTSASTQPLERINAPIDVAQFDAIDGEAAFPIAIDVADGHRGRIRSHGKVRRCSKCLRACAEQNGDVVRAEVCDGHVAQPNHR